MKDEFFLSAYLKHIVHTKIFIILAFLILPYLFFAIDVNIFKFALAPGDGIVQGVPTKIYSARLEIWNQYSQSGTFPFKDIGWQTSYLPGIIVMMLFPNPFGYNLLLLFHYSLAGFFTYLFLRRLRVEKIAAFIGGLSFMFSGFMTGHKGHHTMMMAAAFLPVVLYLLESFLATKKKHWLFLAAFGFGLGILADYSAVSMYIGMVSFPYILFRVISGMEYKNRPALQKIYLILVCSLVLYLGGMMLAAVEILPVVESLQYVTRQQISIEFFTSYSFSPRLLPLLLFPYIYGATSYSFYQTLYFGPWNITELAGYMGILPPLFAALCFFLFRHKNRQLYFWTIIFFFAFLLVLGDSTPFYKFLYRVPVYNLFRAPARNWLEGNFAVAILSSFFIHCAMTASALELKNYYRIVFGIVSALIGAVFVILVFGKLLTQSPEALRLWLQNSRLSSPAVYVPLIMITLSITLVYLLLRNRQNENFWALITVTIFLDLFSFGHFHDTGYPSYKIFQKQGNSVAAFLNAENSDQRSYRILSLNKTDYENQLYPSINLLYGFTTVNAYSPIWLNDYANLTGFETDGTGLKPRILSNSSILSILSTRYIITADPVDKAFLESIMVNRSPGPDHIIVHNFYDKAWNFSGLAARNGESIILAAQEASPVSLMQYSFAPSAMTTYKITFSARMPAKQKANDILSIDFYGEGYDLPEQNTYIHPSEVSSDFRKFTVYLYSGEQPPATVFLRFFTFSTFPYEIRDVQLARSEGYDAYWGQGSSSNTRLPIYNKKYESPEGIAVYENMNFLPRARFVKELISVPDVGAVSYILRYDDAVNPSNVALVQARDLPQKLDDGQVLNADYSEDNTVTLLVRSGASSFLVLADSWYPGWKAFIDGKETPIYKTNGVLRGILIEGTGLHQVQFKFVPISLYIGLGITIVTVLAMLTATIMFYTISSPYRKAEAQAPSV